MAAVTVDAIPARRSAKGEWIAVFRHQDRLPSDRVRQMTVVLCEAAGNRSEWRSIDGFCVFKQWRLVSGVTFTPYLEDPG